MEKRRHGVCSRRPTGTAVAAWHVLYQVLSHGVVCGGPPSVHCSLCLGLSLRSATYLTFSASGVAGMFYILHTDLIVLELTVQVSALHVDLVDLEIVAGCEGESDAD